MRKQTKIDSDHVKLFGERGVGLSKQCIECSIFTVMEEICLFQLHCSPNFVTLSEEQISKETLYLTILI
jgi:hypothetical protein